MEHLFARDVETSIDEGMMHAMAAYGAALDTLLFTPALQWKKATTTLEVYEHNTVYMRTRIGPLCITHLYRSDTKMPFFGDNGDLVEITSDFRLRMLLKIGHQTNPFLDLSKLVRFSVEGVKKHPNVWILASRDRNFVYRVRIRNIGTGFILVECAGQPCLLVYSAPNDLRTGLAAKDQVDLYQEPMEMTTLLGLAAHIDNVDVFAPTKKMLHSLRFAKTAITPMEALQVAATSETLATTQIVATPI